MSVFLSVGNGFKLCCLEISCAVCDKLRDLSRDSYISFYCDLVNQAVHVLNLVLGPRAADANVVIIINPFYYSFAASYMVVAEAGPTRTKKRQEKWHQDLVYRRQLSWKYMIKMLRRRRRNSV